MTTIDNKNTFPKLKHNAVLIFKTIWHEGDERSRTCPGHGYPEHSENVVLYRVFKDDEEMRDYVQRQETTIYGKDNYQLIEAVPLNVQVRTTITK